MPFTVELEPSGTTFSVEPDESVLDAALREQVLLPYGCRNGACGSCKGRVLSGEVSAMVPPKGLSEREIDAGWVLLCQTRPASDLSIAAQTLDGSKDLSVRTLPVRVARKEQLSHDVMALHLQLPPTERLQFLAGQYIDILLKDGRRRAFSLSNAPHDDATLTLHIRHVPDGEFSGHVFGALKERALLRIQGPLGNFFLRTDTRCSRVLVAGGTGFAPIKSMVENALHEGLEDPLHVYWGVRAGEDLYTDVGTTWAAQHSNVSFVPVLSEPIPEDQWKGRTGFVHEAVLEDFGDLSNVEVYASGPPIMVNAIRDTFSERGLAIERLFSDTFDYAYETGHDS